MLVLGRKLGDGVTLILPDGREVNVVVVGLRRGSSRLSVQVGIDAPSDVQIRRYTRERRDGED
jgi:sRNA-binding carbon storage regulator CsrA